MCMAGSAIVENIFSLPGLGYRIVNSLTNRDLPVIYATVLFLAFALVIFNILADIIQRLLQTRKGDLYETFEMDNSGPHHYFLFSRISYRTT